MYASPILLLYLWSNVQRPGIPLRTRLMEQCCCIVTSIASSGPQLSMSSWCSCWRILQQCKPQHCATTPATPSPEHQPRQQPEAVQQKHYVNLHEGPMGLATGSIRCQLCSVQPLTIAQLGQVNNTRFFACEKEVTFMLRMQRIECRCIEWATRALPMYIQWTMERKL
jgi:hypothetical protein